MIWTGQMCVSDKADLDTAISDAVHDLCGVDEQRQILHDSISFWLRCFPAAVKVDSKPSPGQYLVSYYEELQASMRAVKKPMPPARRPMRSAY